jgi:hypothetical protein
MSVEEVIKNFGIKRGADVVGIASVEDMNKYAPEGYRPDDILIDARSVIVLGGLTSKGAWHGRRYNTYVNNQTFGIPYRDRIALEVADFIEKEYGYYAVICSGDALSNSLCTEMSGLGTKSMAADIVLNKDLGLINVDITVTTMPLKADGPLEKQACPHPSCVNKWEQKRTTPCLEACPEYLSGEFEDGKIKWVRFDRRICATKAQTRSAGGFQGTLLEAINEPDPEKRKGIVMGSFFPHNIGAVSTGAPLGQCGECLRSCPIYINAHTLHPKIKPEDYLGERK